MGNDFYFEWEIKLMEWLQSFIGDFGAQMAAVLSMLGEEVVIVAIIGFIYWCYDKEFGRFIGLNILIGLILNPMIKNIALRRRPYLDHPSIKCLRPIDSSQKITDISAQGFSFPSAHSMNSAIVYGSLPRYKKNRKLIVLAVLMPFVVGVSRVMLGMHYPTDVITGWLIGALVVIIVPIIRSKVEKTWLLYLVLILLASIGMIYCKTEDYFTGFGLLMGFLIADLFERRYVNFRMTRKPLECITRIIGGFAIYGLLNFIIKAPFSKEYLESELFSNYLLRVFRYAVIAFVAFGLYPMTFRKIGRLFNRNEHREGEGNN